MTYKVRGAESTVLSKEMVMVERRRKLLLSMVGIPMFLFEVFVVGISGLGDQVRFVCRQSHSQLILFFCFLWLKEIN